MFVWVADLDLGIVANTLSHGLERLIIYLSLTEFLICGTCAFLIP